jgi:spore germination protein GerM
MTMAVVATGVIALVIWQLPHWLMRKDSTPPATSAPLTEARRIRATLFYVSDDGNQLVAVDREVQFSAGPSDQARRILELQTAAAPGGLVSAIPPGTVVRSVYMTPNGNAYVDLSKEASTAHTGGSLDEALTVFTIVNALTTNLPDIKAVQILIDGKEVDTLAGHLDLRRPLARAPEWVRKDTPRS